MIDYRQESEDKLLEDARIIYDGVTSRKLIDKPSELYRFMNALTGETVPFHKVCENHGTPWDMIWESYKVDLPENKKNLLTDIVAVGPREGFKTLSTAKLIALELLLKPKIDIASIGAIIKQAARCYKYTSKYLFHPVLAEMQKVIKNIMDETILDNGSRYEQLVATMSGTNCLSGDTLIETLGKRGRIRIKDLVGKKNKWLFAWDEKDQKFKPDRMKRAWCVGKAKVYDVVLDNCVTIRGTSDHPVWVRGKGWIPIKYLKTGDSLEPLQRHLSNPGDGTRIYWHLKEGPRSGWIKEAHWIINNTGGTIGPRDHVHHRGESYDNRPKMVEVVDISYHARLTIKERYEKSGRTVPKNLLGHGEHKREKRSKEWKKLGSRLYDETLIQRVKNLYIDGLLSSVKIAEILNTTGRIIQRIIDKNIPREKIRNRSDAAILRKVNSLNHRVLLVRPAGYEDVYDIEMEKYESFVGNGIVLHNSPHPQKLRADEVELMKPEVVEEMKNIPSSYNGWTAHTLYTSTRKFIEGVMSQLVTNAKKKGGMTKTIIWCYKEVSEPCPDDRSGINKQIYEIEDIFHHGEKIAVEAYEYCGDCQLLPSCRGDLKKSKGVIPIDDSLKKWIDLDRDTWLAQKESIEPPRTGLFYYDWDEKFMVGDFKFNSKYPLDLFIDFTGGGEDPTIMQFWQTWDDLNDYLVLELSFYKKGTDMVAREVEQICHEKGIPRPQIMMGDSSQMQQIRDFRAASPFFSNLRPVKKVERKEGLMICKRRLKDNTGRRHTFIDERCINFKKEIKNLKRKPSDPDDHRDGNDHSMDAWRYRNIYRYYSSGEPRIRVLSEISDDGSITDDEMAIPKPIRIDTGNGPSIENAINRYLQEND